MFNANKTVKWIGGLKWATIAGVEPLKKEIVERAKSFDLKPNGIFIQTSSVRQVGFITDISQKGMHSLGAYLSSVTDSNIEKPSQILVVEIDNKNLIIASHEGMILHDDYAEDDHIIKEIIGIFTKTSIEFNVQTNSNKIYDLLTMQGITVELDEVFFDKIIASKKTQTEKLIKLPKPVFYGIILSVFIGVLFAAYYFYPDESQEAVTSIINPEEQQRLQNEQASAVAYSAWFSDTIKNGVSLTSLVTECLKESYPMPITEADGWGLNTITCTSSSVTQNWTREKGTLKRLIAKHPEASYNNLNSSSRTYSISYTKNSEIYDEQSFIDKLPLEKKVMIDYGSNIQTVNNVKGVKADIKEAGTVAIQSYIGKPIYYKKIELTGENINHLMVIAKGFDGYEVRSNSLTINIENKEKTKWLLNFTIYHQ